MNKTPYAYFAEPIVPNIWSYAWVKTKPLFTMPYPYGMPAGEPTAVGRGHHADLMRAAALNRVTSTLMIYRRGLYDHTQRLMTEARAYRLAGGLQELP